MIEKYPIKKVIEKEATKNHGHGFSFKYNYHHEKVMYVKGIFGWKKDDAYETVDKDTLRMKESLLFEDLDKLPKSCSYTKPIAIELQDTRNTTLTEVAYVENCKQVTITISDEYATKKYLKCLEEESEVFYKKIKEDHPEIIQAFYDKLRTKLSFYGHEAGFFDYVDGEMKYFMTCKSLGMKDLESMGQSRGLILAVLHLMKKQARENKCETNITIQLVTLPTSQKDAWLVKVDYYQPQKVLKSW